MDEFLRDVGASSLGFDETFGLLEFGDKSLEFESEDSFEFSPPNIHSLAPPPPPRESKTRV